MGDRRTTVEERSAIRVLLRQHLDQIPPEHALAISLGVGVDIAKRVGFDSERFTRMCRELFEHIDDGVDDVPPVTVDR